MPANALSTTLRESLEEIERADLVAGIPSFNNAGTIALVVRSVRDGLHAAFPDERCVIMNSDGGSADGTPELARTHDSEDLRVISGTYEGPPGKGSALRAVFEAVDRLGARAGCVLDSDLRSVTAQWVPRLLRPVAEGRADYVTPLYIRHKHDGTITNTVMYPLVRALYGRRVRQPIGGEFGFSADLGRAFLAEDVWSGDVARFGIDIFMTTTALARGARLRQAALGAKIHDPKDPAAHLGPMFAQVLGSAIRQFDRQRPVWRAISGSEEVPAEGELSEEQTEEVSVDLARLDAAFAAAGPDERNRWYAVICSADRDLFAEHARDRRPADAELARLWARIVYDVVGTSIIDAATTELNVRALLPLYFARVAAHVRASAGLSSAQSEPLVEEQARAFELEKPHLLERIP